MSLQNLKYFINIFLRKGIIISSVLHITFRLYMTLPAPLKAMRSIAGAGNVAERKHHKGRKPDWCFLEPSRLQAAYIYNPVEAVELITFLLLIPIFLFCLIFYIFYLLLNNGFFFFIICFHIFSLKA